MDIKTLLKKHEGCIPHAYLDSLGYLTIGVGRLIDKQKGGRLSDDEIDYLLDNDIKKVQKELMAFAWYPQLDPVRQMVVESMAFNLGIEGFSQFKNTIAFIAAGKYAEAADNMLKSKWASQVGKRATELANMMRSGEAQP